MAVIEFPDRANEAFVVRIEWTLVILSVSVQWLDRPA